MHIVIVGAGRAGTSFFDALTRAQHDVTLRHHDELGRVGDPDLVLLCVPDDAIADVARALPPVTGVVAHVAGSRTLDVLGDHPRRASLHPLCALPTRERGAARLVGATYVVAGDDVARDLVASLQGRARTIRDEDRTRYHATAAVCANHVVALLGHVAALAASAGLDLADFLDLAAQALDDVAALGPGAALTGPAARGDVATVDAHLAALPADQRATYVALANAAFELAESRQVAPSA
jgi:predicted short-subunit dehydrogenase-like oxidoreductase (DUF2520 family)